MKRLEKRSVIITSVVGALLLVVAWIGYHPKKLPPAPGTPSFVNKNAKTKNQFGPEIFGLINKAKDVLLADRSKVRGKDTRLAAMEIKTEKIVLVTAVVHGPSSPPGYTIEAGKRNGVNTRYDVSHPPGYVVLAIKREVKIHGVQMAVVYTPYNEGLDVPLIRQAGLKYLLKQIELAKADLRDREVKSAAYHGKSVHEVVPDDVALQLSLIEHIDPARIGRGVLTEDLANEVLVTVACNGQNAYKFAVSKTGARGLFQFMPGTYKGVRKKYPAAGLDQDFVLGMGNHVNGAKASLLLFDSDLSYLKSERRTWIAKHPDAMGVYLAASYNCGAGHIEKTIQKYGEGWMKHLNRETTAYVKKFEDVRKALDK